MVRVRVSCESGSKKWGQRQSGKACGWWQTCEYNFGKNGATGENKIKKNSERKLFV